MLGKKVGTVSEINRGGNWGFIVRAEGGNFIFVYSSECRPQVLKIFVVGNRVEYEEHFDSRRGKVRA